MAKQSILNRLRVVVRIFLMLAGVLFLLILVLSFTTLPYWGYYWLGTSKSEKGPKPDYIVLLGGGGMPSESNLMRAFYVHRAAIEAPESQIIISIPGSPDDSLSTARLVANELVAKGIAPERIIYEQVGTNTRSQALQLQEFNSEDITRKRILLVTSPEHMRRAVLVFRKAGFENVYALPAFESAIEANLFFEDDQLGSDKLLVPDIGGNTTVRYQFWNHLKYEILIAREISALSYYWVRGWI